MCLRVTCSAVLPTIFPPPAPWDLRISLRPVPAPWRIWRTKKQQLFFSSPLHALLFNWMQLSEKSDLPKMLFLPPMRDWRDHCKAPHRSSPEATHLSTDKTITHQLFHTVIYTYVVVNFPPTTHWAVSDCLPPPVDWSCLERCRLRFYALLPVAQWRHWWFFFVSPQVHLQNCHYWRLKTRRVTGYDEMGQFLEHLKLA